MAKSKAIGKRELDTFKSYFGDYKDQYVLIGGSATKLVLEDADLRARATKDLDIVLCAKALAKEFVTKFWEFISAGGYEIKKKLNGGSVYYRFERPTVDGFPYMIELLSERVEYFEETDQIVLPLVIDDDVVSLSAIILNQEYYDFLMNNKVELDGIVIADERLLIPLKVSAYLDLKRRRDAGEPIKGDDIRKHKNDVIRLTMLLSGVPTSNVPSMIKDEIRAFTDELSDEGDLLRNLGIGIQGIESIKQLLRTVYGAS